LGNIVGGGELKIDPYFALLTIYAGGLKIVIWIRGFLGAAQCWRINFVYFSSNVVHFHSLAVVQKVFQWGGKQQEEFDALKQKISTTPVLALLDLR